MQEEPEICRCKVCGRPMKAREGDVRRRVCKECMEDEDFDNVLFPVFFLDE